MLLSGWFAGARTFVVLDLSFVAGNLITLFFTATVTCCICFVSVLFLIFVLVVCSPLLLLSGWFAGARTFVVLDLSFVAGIFRTLFFTVAVTCCICCVSVFPIS